MSELILKDLKALIELIALGAVEEHKVPLQITFPERVPSVLKSTLLESCVLRAVLPIPLSLAISAEYSCWGWKSW